MTKNELILALWDQYAKLYGLPTDKLMHHPNWVKLWEETERLLDRD